MKAYYLKIKRKDVIIIKNCGGWVVRELLHTLIIKLKTVCYRASVTYHKQFFASYRFASPEHGGSIGGG